MKDGLDRTGKKSRLKVAKIACTGMCHRMHFLDLQCLYVFWTAGLTIEGEISLHFDPPSRHSHRTRSPLLWALRILYLDTARFIKLLYIRSPF